MFEFMLAYWSFMTIFYHKSMFHLASALEEPRNWDDPMKMIKTKERN